jgi:hypothetical protein
MLATAGNLPAGCGSRESLASGLPVSVNQATRVTVYDGAFSAWWVLQEDGNAFDRRAMAPVTPELWRKRVRVERTIDPLGRPIAGFEEHTEAPARFGKFLMLFDSSTTYKLRDLNRPVPISLFVNMVLSQFHHSTSPTTGRETMTH